MNSSTSTRPWRSSNRFSPTSDRREAYETLSIVPTLQGSLMLYLDEGHGMGTGGATFTQEPDPAAVSTVTTPTGQTFALDADTVLTLYPYEAASGTCYRIYLRGSENLSGLLAGRNPGLLGPPRPGHRRFPLLTRPQAKTAHGH